MAGEFTAVPDFTVGEVLTADDVNAYFGDNLNLFGTATPVDGGTLVWESVGGAYVPRQLKPSEIAQEGAATNQVLAWDGSKYAPATIRPTLGGASVVTPTATSSATYVMMGMGASFTPVTSSGKAILLASGSFTGNETNSQIQCQLAFGTGSAPANGAASTGSVVGPAAFAAGLGGTLFVPFALMWPISVTTGVTYWLDLAVAVSVGAGGGAQGPLDATVFAVEIA
jgi:hypothetical protein